MPSVPPAAPPGDYSLLFLHLVGWERVPNGMGPLGGQGSKRNQERSIPPIYISLINLSSPHLICSLASMYWYVYHTEYCKPDQPLLGTCKQHCLYGPSLWERLLCRLLCRIERHFALCLSFFSL